MAMDTGNEAGSDGNREHLRSIWKWVVEAESG